MQPSPLVDLPIQYVDYTVWQQQWLHSIITSDDEAQISDQHTNSQKEKQTRLEKHLAYWKRQLGGELPILNLPVSQPRPSIQAFQGAHLSIRLPERLMHELKDLSRQTGVSLFMTLLASFQVLLARYTGLED